MSVNNDTITQAEIDDGLTEEERRALAEGDDDAGDTTTDDNNDKGGHDNDQDDKKNNGDDGDGSAADDAGDDQGKAGGAAGRDDGEDDDAGAKQQEESPKQAAPVFVAEAPADAETKLSDLRTQKTELRTKYEDGEITFAEYEEQKDALIEQEGEIKRAVERAQLASEMEAQRQKNQWDADCNAFMSDHPEYADREGERFKQINEAVIALANMPSNKALTGPQILEKAHRVVLATNGEAAPAQSSKKGGVDYKKPDQPVNLAKVPAAAQTDTGEGRFAAIDKLEGIALEEALAKMSDSERDAYLAAQ